MVIELTWVHCVAIGFASLVLGLWRWSMPLLFGAVLLWASYAGHWFAFPYVILCAGEIISAWTGESWMKIVWELVRPNGVEQ